MKTELLMMKEGGSLHPYGQVAWEIFDRVITKKPLLVILSQPRNPKHHNKLWGLAAKVADFDKDFTDAEDAVSWVKLHIPSMRRFYKVEGNKVWITTKSINFASMDQVSFNAFYDNALRLWAEKIGCDPEALLDANSQA